MEGDDDYEGSEEEDGSEDEEEVEGEGSDDEEGGDSDGKIAMMLHNTHVGSTTTSCVFRIYFCSLHSCSSFFISPLQWTGTARTTT